jgi:membrane fusion protein, multidrug efflux system
MKIIDLLVVLGLCYSVTGNARSLDTVTVQAQMVANYLNLDAKIEAVHKTTLAAQTSGQIEQIFVDAGDLVPAGTQLLRIQHQQQQASVDAAQAALTASLADLQEAKASLSRAQGMFKQKLLAQQVLDDARARLKISQANVDATKARLAGVQQQLAYTVVVAPYAGIVLERHVNLGEIVSVGTPLFTGTSLAKLRVVSQIPQQDLAAIKRYAQVQVILPDGAQFIATEQQLKFYAYASASNASFKVTVALPETATGSFPGMFVKAQFKTGERTVLTVPRQAVLHRAELRAVYVQDPQKKLHLRQLRLGSAVDEQSVEVLAGLLAGEQVMLRPQLALQQLTDALAAQVAP